MSILATHSEVRELLRPEPRSPIAIRVAIERDLKFIDDLQKKHGKMVAFASHKELRSYIEQGQTALVAEECERDEETKRRRDEENEVCARVRLDPFRLFRLFRLLVSSSLSLFVSFACSLLLLLLLRFFLFLFFPSHRAQVHDFAADDDHQRAGAGPLESEFALVLRIDQLQVSPLADFD
jgi:hypothetical protein